MGPSPDEVKRHLAVRILALARELIPDGHIEGSEWRGHGPDGATWGIVIKGGKVGCYQNFGAGHGGTSALALVRDAACGGDHLRAYAWALAFLGDAVREPIPRAAPTPATPAKPKNGLSLFLAGRAFTWDCPAGLYLQARGISPALLAGQALRVLRYLPTCWHSDAGCNLPAMLAAVIDPLTGEHLATHRTYLGREPDGTWRKTKARPAKKCLGSPVGGVIALTRGASNKPITKAPDGDGALIAEGIENALTLAQFYGELRALAAVSIGNLPSISLPPAIARLVYCRDRDGENLQVQRTRDRALARWIKEGRAPSVWEPPAEYHDVNDYWRSVRGGCHASA